VSDELIGEVLASDESLEARCQRLIDAANAGGGPDNITTLIVQVDAS
jgi:protein phosphatase